MKNNKKMLKEGQVVHFLMNGYPMSGKALNVTGNEDDYTFSIEGYSGCAGPHIISSQQIHLTVFLTKEEAEKYKDITQMYLPSYC